MYMKTWLLMIGLLLALGTSAFARTIVAAGDPWPPFVDPKNPTDGLSLEIIRAAYKTQDYDVKMVYVPWARAEAGVKEGTYDILAATWHTPERSKFLRFSTPYAVNAIKFIKFKGDPFEYKGLDSLRGKRVGTVRGYGYSDPFLKDAGFVREEVTDLMQNIKKVVDKRVDLTLDDEIVVRFILGQDNIKLLDMIEFSKESLSSNPLHVTSGLKNPRHKEIIDAFNAGYEIIKSNGTLAVILKKYHLTP
jgi:polar amino acid transport system substrate-binding protein